LTFKLVEKQVKINKLQFMFPVITISGKDAEAEANFGTNI